MTMTVDRPQLTADDIATGWLNDFASTLGSRDIEAAMGLFAATSFWRDLVSFSWNLTTTENHDGIRDLLQETLDRVDPSDFALAEPAETADGVTTAWFTFTTSVGRGKGLVRLIDEDGTKAWTLLTSLQELTGHEEPRGIRRVKGAEHGVDPQRKSWSEKRAEEDAAWGETAHPYVLVVGGGQGGIALGARLRQLGVPALVIDRWERPGDQWRSRYKSLCLHDPVWYDHLPYLKFPDNWPVFAPKDKIADWLEFYTRVMEIPYWSSTTATSASYDEGSGQWTVVVERGGETITLTPTHLVMATGMSGKPNIPSFPGSEVFRGEQQHSSQHPGPDAYAGKRVVVIGSNNSAFDICGALYENGADVTMVQRSSTHIVKSDSLMEIGLGALYSEEAVAAGVTTEKADLIFASLPYRIMHEFQIPLYEQMKERDADFYRRMEEAGFDLDFGDDGSGLFLKYLRRGSGYYIDVGAAELVADGKVRLAKGQVDHLSEDAVVLDDGTELPADLVVYATGYGSMNGWVADLVDQETADRVGKCWGLGSDTTKDPGPWEGEQRNMWKPTQQENLWFQGGNLHQSRHYSLYLALQLKARFEGIDTPVYRLQEVHHLG
ncbi:MULTISPECIES: flavin-containing monooxygenase [Brevibacterium]|uniref:FAD-dependent oxidoreductase n=2 Tax=Brevibacterium casei TaxID=33889 RepID=A0A269ZGU2_9MICO|nr:NAD(P)/FAD-dependent oxidoreductase [Brevibacterium casei]NJE66509.1 NAD(P)/FAD-dependent oxidoreductase [Brevibacterium sp. LS14]MBE4695177.1 NAD(P)/FAD-dependent oxidoreductase [Brevibacterium casei]MBY3578299.1 NAD(P)/FAD-dependent oxidoreductase [Brevibacterium casei]MCT1447541.1 NAD(P)/FAD-dependent oxidoreductase [Brevibacterium casei]MCT1550205.1 NAD(P)/FAD-dependent oxidoreductase [Brevibacterium casei]